MVCKEKCFATTKIVITVSTRTDNGNHFISTRAAAEKETVLCEHRRQIQLMKFTSIIWLIIRRNFLMKL